MKGATEYAKLFETGQYGRLYLVSYSHARGECFHVFVLPEGEAAIPNGSSNAPLNKNGVEVFGIKGGQPGWTETYGWLHKGKWQDNFFKLVDQEKIKEKNIKDKQQKQIADKDTKETAHIQKLLQDY